MYRVTRTQPHFITVSSGFWVNASYATYAVDTGTVANHPYRSAFTAAALIAASTVTGAGPLVGRPPVLPDRGVTAAVARAISLPTASIADDQARDRI
jgi:hypothetical protein